MSPVAPGEIAGRIDCVFTSGHVIRRSGGDCREYRLRFYLQSCHSSFRGRLPGVSMAFSPPVMSPVAPGEIAGRLDGVFTSNHVTGRSGGDCRASRWRFYLQSCHRSLRGRLSGVSIAFSPPIMSPVVPVEIVGSIDGVFTSSHVTGRSGGDCREYRLRFHLQSCHRSFRWRLSGVSIAFSPPVMSFVAPGEIDTSDMHPTLLFDVLIIPPTGVTIRNS
jgi:hypothetical protein